ncbi:MAG: 3-hydroxyacyl-CoA dehydrogenase NAD-binding domain-containing protein [Acidiferrobacterales bacterium]|nr:3-hydroxyacyl-CoA dehydrogenase NAD-binding domain-containing protein [Acidiferrobacterales bacterium]
MKPISQIGVVGAGLIGSGWISRCSARNIDVLVYDPSPDGEQMAKAHVDNAWVALEKLGFGRERSGSVSFCDDLEEVAATCDFIQESAPENLELKKQLHQQMDSVAPPQVIIASSSSGLLPSEIQAQVSHPDRILIGHPFNPVYILPLVEIVTGEHTSEHFANEAADFYRSIGMYPLMVRKEIEGYVSDRIQEAVWREALHMIADGVASTKDIDDAIVYGPGLRWAIMGVCLTFHLAGGDQGMRHMLHQFGPALKLPWTHMEAPELTDDLIDRMVSGTQTQAAGRSIRELEQLRDNCLIEILEVLNRYEFAAGNTQFKADPVGPS